MAVELDYLSGNFIPFQQMVLLRFQCVGDQIEVPSLLKYAWEIVSTMQIPDDVT